MQFLSIARPSFDELWSVHPDGGGGGRYIAGDALDVLFDAVLGRLSSSF